MHLRTRITLLSAVLGLCLCAIAILFWRQEMKYQLPTPVPENYVAVSTGDHVQLPEYFQKGKAYFLHFYNPDCPCSRFNVKHLRTLIGEFHDSIAIVIVVPSANDLAKVKSTFGDDVEIIEDPNESIAQRCGVYSTPQAAIVDQTHALYYRGNYNRSRYCTARATNFAELSLVALLHRNPPPMFGLEASKSYGCELYDHSNPEIEIF
jgi:hypothetical protein